MSRDQGVEADHQPSTDRRPVQQRERLRLGPRQAELTRRLYPGMRKYARSGLQVSYAQPEVVVFERCRPPPGNADSSPCSCVPTGRWHRSRARRAGSAAGRWRRESQTFRARSIRCSNPRRHAIKIRCPHGRRSAPSTVACGPYGTVARGDPVHPVDLVVADLVDVTIDPISTSHRHRDIRTGKLGLARMSRSPCIRASTAARYPCAGGVP